MKKIIKKPDFGPKGTPLRSIKRPYKIATYCWAFAFVVWFISTAYYLNKDGFHLEASKGSVEAFWDNIVSLVFTAGLIFFIFSVSNTVELVIRTLDTPPVEKEPETRI